MFDIGDIVRLDGRKAKVLNKWWDNFEWRYEVRLVIGRNLAGTYWSVTGKSLSEYKKGK